MTRHCITGDGLGPLSVSRVAMVMKLAQETPTWPLEGQTVAFSRGGPNRSGPNMVHWCAVTAQVFVRLWHMQMVSGILARCLKCVLFRQDWIQHNTSTLFCCGESIAEEVERCVKCVTTRYVGRYYSDAGLSVRQQRTERRVVLPRVYLLRHGSAAKWTSLVLHLQS